MILNRTAAAAIRAAAVLVAGHARALAGGGVLFARATPAKTPHPLIEARPLWTASSPAAAYNRRAPAALPTPLPGLDDTMDERRDDG